MKVDEESCCVLLVPCLFFQAPSRFRCLPRAPPDSWWWIPNAKLFLQFFNILIPSLLPVNGYQALRAPSTPERPRNMLLQPIAPCRREHARCSNSRQTRHRKSQVREFKRLHNDLVFDAHWHRSDTVVEVVTFAIPLHHVGEFWIVDVMNLRCFVNDP